MSKLTHRWTARANQAEQTAAHQEENPAYLNRPRPLYQAPPLALLDPSPLRSAFSLLFLSAQVLPHPPLLPGNILSSQELLPGKSVWEDFWNLLPACSEPPQTQNMVG